VIDGTQECLPKKTWVFTKNVYIKLKVLKPVKTDHLHQEDVYELMRSVRGQQAAQLAEWRDQPVTRVDSTIEMQ